MITNEGLTYLLGVGFKNAAPIADWYVAIFEGNYTPVAGVTAANFVANATECTAYSEAGRPAWVDGAITGNVVDNSASKAEFTFTANKTIYGAALTSVSTKGASTGTLPAIARFATPRTVETNDILRITVPVDATNV